MVRYLIIIGFLLSCVACKDTDRALHQPLVVENNQTLIPHGDGVSIIPIQSFSDTPLPEINMFLREELIMLGFFGFFTGNGFAEIPLVKENRVSNVPFGTCDPNQDPYKCAKPVINSFTSNFDWLKPGRKVSFQLSMDNYSEAILAAYDYYTQKLTIIQQWKPAFPQRTNVLKSNYYQQNNDTIYHLEVKNPHGQSAKSFDIFNFRIGQSKPAFVNANKNSPKILSFKAVPNPVSINSPSALKFSFIGADEYFLIINNALVDHKKSLDPDNLQDHRYRYPVFAPLSSDPHLVLIRNLSSDPEKNKRADKYLSLKTSPPAEIIEFSSNKSAVKAGEKVSFRIKIKGASHIFLDMQEDGGSLTSMPLNPIPQMPLQRAKAYQFATFMNMSSNTNFRLRISNPDSGEPITKMIRIPVSKNYVTDQLEIRSLTAPQKFAAGEKVWVRFVATNAASYKLYSNETFSGPGTGPDISSGTVTTDNFGFVTKSIPIVLNRPATTLTLEVTHSTGGSVTKTIPIEMYWKVKFNIPLKVTRTSPSPSPYVDKLTVTCRMGDRYLARNFGAQISQKENYIKSLVGKDTVEIDLAPARYHSGFGRHSETHHYLLKFEQELQFKPSFFPKLVPFTCSFGSAKICEKVNGKWLCNKFDDHTKFAKSFKERYDSPIDPKYYHIIDFSQHGDFSKPYEFSIKKTMEWVEKP